MKLRYDDTNKIITFYKPKSWQYQIEIQGLKPKEKDTGEVVGFWKHIAVEEALNNDNYTRNRVNINHDRGRKMKVTITPKRTWGFKEEEVIL